MNASRRAFARCCSSWWAASSTCPARTATTSASSSSSSFVKASISVESTSTSPIPTPCRTIGTASQEWTADDAALPRIRLPSRTRSPDRYGRSVSMTDQLRLGPWRSVWPTASSANGPIAARTIRSSPLTRAIEPPVRGMTDRSRPSASWRIWSRSSSAEAAAAISMISREVASDRTAASSMSTDASVASTGASYAGPGSEVQQELGDLEIDDEAGPIDERRDQWGRHDRRVDPEAAQGQREDGGHRRRPAADREDRDRHDEADVRVHAEQRRPAQRDRRHDRAEDQPDPELLPDDPADVPKRHLVEGHRTDDQSHGLAADVATGPDQQRNEEAEGDGRRELVG